MSKTAPKYLRGPLIFHGIGRLLYTNCALRTDFRYGQGIAKHMVWWFWWLTGDYK